MIFLIYDVYIELSSLIHIIIIKGSCVFSKLIGSMLADLMTTGFQTKLKCQEGSFFLFILDSDHVSPGV